MCSYSNAVEKEDSKSLKQRKLSEIKQNFGDFEINTTENKKKVLKRTGKEKNKPKVNYKRIF